MTRRVIASPKLRRPFATKLIMEMGGTVADPKVDRLRAPIGWVFGDIYINFNSTSYLRFAMSSDRGLNSWPGLSVADNESGELPIAWDFDSPSGWYPSTSNMWEWTDIGFGEIRTIFTDSANEWSENAVMVAGVLVPDPRRAC